MNVSLSYINICITLPHSQLTMLYCVVSVMGFQSYLGSSIDKHCFCYCRYWCRCLHFYSEKVRLDMICFSFHSQNVSICMCAVCFLFSFREDKSGWRMLSLSNIQCKSVWCMLSLSIRECKSVWCIVSFQT